MLKIQNGYICSNKPSFSFYYSFSDIMITRTRIYAAVTFMCFGVQSIFSVNSYISGQFIEIVYLAYMIGKKLN